ncbi:hypothetical protein [Peptostreptococcus porci]|uniref:hypothetical protein n=1 Tax=Peptostreptococcus porci TaxID=2652282 RepID=UPI0012B39E99|nr:hypothetical protein [Peptostreptococcus porci]MDD7183513.1 hypothetical protein [Peptostreptococcus porci]MDY4128746.1 hypothetical protein [Peptostreptococcus porci]MDY5436537.1 hypothetical protein [Peptostreptococcus porci]MDY5480051.1 hypothetical protein [Peptostreptococcus porci]
MEWIKETKKDEIKPASACVFNICLNRKGPCKSLCFAFACLGTRFCLFHGKECVHYNGK